MMQRYARQSICSHLDHCDDFLSWPKIIGRLFVFASIEFNGPNVGHSNGMENSITQLFGKRRFTHSSKWDNLKCHFNFSLMVWTWFFRFFHFHFHFYFLLQLQPMEWAQVFDVLLEFNCHLKHANNGNIQLVTHMKWSFEILAH